MGYYDYLLLAGVVAALAFGIFRFPLLLSYIVFLIIGAWPVYNLSQKYDLNFVRGSLMVAIFFAIYAGLYWIAGKFADRKST